MFERRKNLRGHVSEGQFPSDTAAFPQTIASSVAQITNNERCYSQQFSIGPFRVGHGLTLFLSPQIRERDPIGQKEVAKAESRRE